MATKPKKRKCVLTESILIDFPYIRPGPTENYAFCTLCQTAFTIASGGRSTVKEHSASKRHLRASQSCSVKETPFFKTYLPDAHEFSFALQEGTFAFHTIKHHQSFLSMDCSASLIKRFYECKFSCSKSRCETIITDVLARWAEDTVLQDIHKASYVTLLTDASNNGCVKLFPVLLQYVIIDTQPMGDCSVQVKTKLVDFFQTDGETTEALSEDLLQVIRRVLVEDKIVGMSADNMNTDFGGLKRKGTNNVVVSMRESLKRNVIALGCITHIVHSCAQCSVDMIPLDIQGMVTKICGFFHTFSVRAECLREFCDFVGQQWKEIQSYSNVQWLALLPFLRKVLQHYAALKSFFLSEEKCPVVLKKWFLDPSTLLWLEFANSSLSLFQDTLIKVENQEGTAVESSVTMNNFIQKISARRSENFIPPKVKTILSSLEEHGSYTIACFFKVSNDFYTTALQYLNAWSVHFEHVDKMECILLKHIPERQSFEHAVHFFLSKSNLVDIKEDELFDEITCLKSFVTKEKVQQWNSNSDTTCERWSQVFSHFSQKSASFTQLKTIVELMLCMPGSSAQIQKVFSAMNMMLEADYSQLSVQTLKSILMVLINFPMSCQEFAVKLAHRKDILQMIQSLGT
ncbi:uncharacterized protein LOC108704684 [Xenopus laevis]|uniref:Uncharacterized protein LOC108704684 n=1 Tax=Xenopus laevis TaxID=8355 RepID=A0A8J0U5Z2_XENLA|nr:uncharacterized protein LOC108704684 [Xenopus laevis]OCT57593.1 hypothetical protein XELAEV_18003295mg [Xenopus laevis]